MIRDIGIGVIRHMKMFRVIFAAALAALVLAVMSFCVLADIEADGKIIIAIDPGHGGIDGGTDVGTETRYGVAGS